MRRKRRMKKEGKVEGNIKERQQRKKDVKEERNKD